MLPKPCGKCGKPTRDGSLCNACRATLPPRQHGPDHTLSATARGYGSKYQRNRAIVLRHARLNGDPCVICHKPIGPHDLTTAEHLVPRREGGNSDLDNLGPAHRSCNIGWNRGKHIARAARPA